MPLALPTVTLLTATGATVDGALTALRLSMRGIEFAAVKLLAPEAPATLPAGITHVTIPPMDLNGYNRLVLNDLHRHFTTAHCLIVQADGFVLDPARWQDAFLDYDYVGAPWEPRLPMDGSRGGFELGANRVGNGGFSLRSHRLAATVAALDVAARRLPLQSEDLVICHYLYGELAAMGLRFAPLELAAQFSMECPYHLCGQTLGTVFGFHGKHLLPEVSFRLRCAELDRLGARAATLPCPCGSRRRYGDCHGRPGTQP
jgi:hypothetical protein